MRWLRFLFLVLVPAGFTSNRLQAVLPVEITEFMAGGQHVVADEDDEFPDWIELHNTTTNTVSLADWRLTDDPAKPAKWRFPATNLVGGGYLVVFASEKNRRIPGEPLHTNFKLSGRGEYLALHNSEGVLSTEFAPRYPIQVPGIAFGFSGNASFRSLLGAGSRLRYWVPEDPKFGSGWTAPGFDDSKWHRGQNGIGFELTPDHFAPFLKTDIQRLMHGRFTSCYIRLPFLVTNLAETVDAALQVQYDDGFVAWLNGAEVARRNAPAPVRWNSSATATRPDAQAITPEKFELATHRKEFTLGTNWLAIQVLNASHESSDLLMLVALETRAPLSSSPLAAAHYLTAPSPGKPNPGGPDRVGPLIQNVSPSPSRPADNDDIRVDAQVSPVLGDVAELLLHYRVMFDPELVVPMQVLETRNAERGTWKEASGDSSTPREAEAATVTRSEPGNPAKQDRGKQHSKIEILNSEIGGGLYRAIIPASATKPGQLVRYYVTARDQSGRISRWPIYPDRRDSSAYLGLVITDPTVVSKLPVLQLFVPPDWAQDDFEAGFFGLSYDGEYYDNVRFRQHGQISRHFPKPSFNLDFPRDHRFRYRAGQTRVKDIKLLANYADKSKLRNTLAYEFIAASGSLGHFAFPIRVQRNGKFYSVAEFVEDGDDRWLARIGRDPQGALYKMYDNLSSAHGAEKKTRKHEDHADLEQLISALAESRPLVQRSAWAWDHLDLPQTISYFVAMALISSDDNGHKNYYLYRDSRGSGEWAILPWDVDLSWGRNWTGQYFDETIYSDNPIDLYRFGRRKPHNRLYSLIFENPEFRQMYLRRLRTVMDTVLLPPGAPRQDLRIEKRIRELIDAIDPHGAMPSDAALDERRWPSWGDHTTARAEAQRILEEYLPGRRQFLFQNRNAQLSGERIPGAQPGNTTLAMGTIEANPASRNPAEQFVGLVNTNEFAVDLAGWTLAGAGISHVFRPGTVVPARKELFVTPDVAAFRQRKNGPKGGQSLMVQGNFRGRLGAGNSPLVLTDPAGRKVASRDLESSDTGGR